MADARWNSPEEPTRAQAQAAVFLRRPLIWIALWLVLEALIIKLVAANLGLGSTFLLLFAKSGAGLFLVIWMTGRAFVRMPRTGFSLARFERIGFGVLAGLMLMMPGFVLSLLVLALFAPGVRRMIMSRVTAPPNDGMIVLEPGEWREIDPEKPVLGPDPPQRP
ncbi:MAG: FxsA family protein [Rhizobiales bacterium]|nr:FxsA family protein [Hyphomicrobiales bacterium]